MEKGVLGNKTGRGFFWKEGKVRHVLEPVSGNYRPESEIKLPDLSYIDDVAALYSQARYAEGIQVFLAAEGDEAALARRVVGGYISYAFLRVGEVTDTIEGIDRIMGAGFNWAPPSVLVDTMGPASAVRMIEEAGLTVPEALSRAAATGEPKRFFRDRRVNTGKFFVAS
jgi:3-hydroxyacyl-CoA dehydrogenase